MKAETDDGSRYRDAAQFCILHIIQYIIVESVKVGPMETDQSDWFAEIHIDFLIIKSQ
jgi:hypothetical protein